METDWKTSIKKIHAKGKHSVLLHTADNQLMTVKVTDEQDLCRLFYWHQESNRKKILCEYPTSMQYLMLRDGTRRVYCYYSISPHMESKINLPITKLLLENNADDFDPPVPDTECKVPEEYLRNCVANHVVWFQTELLNDVEQLTDYTADQFFKDWASFRKIPEPKCIQLAHWKLFTSRSLLFYNNVKSSAEQYCVTHKLPNTAGIREKLYQIIWGALLYHYFGHERWTECDSKWTVFDHEFD